MEDALDPITQAVRAQADMYLVMGHVYPVHQIVLHKGLYMPGSPFRGRQMEPRACFVNAISYARRHGLRYAEGYALSGSLTERGMVLPIEHAWCVDEDGAVVDPTWEDPASSHYLGLIFDTDEVLDRVTRKGTYGMFVDGTAVGRVDMEYLETLMPGIAELCRKPSAQSEPAIGATP